MTSTSESLSTLSTALQHELSNANVSMANAQRLTADLLANSMAQREGLRAILLSAHEELAGAIGPDLHVRAVRNHIVQALRLLGENVEREQHHAAS